jgi:hypothetical protein
LGYDPDMISPKASANVSESLPTTTESNDNLKPTIF